MRIALLHYHLRPGGVTTVIRDQHHALVDEHGCLVFTGEAPEKSNDRRWEASIRVVPGVGYAGTDGADADPRRTAAAIRAAMTAEWGRAADILHVHNPTLNKNPRLIKCLRVLQEEGQKLFAQIHDFAEEGRPRSFRERLEKELLAPVQLCSPSSFSQQPYLHSTSPRSSGA